ncbi:MAG: proline--tRNA ligase [Pseudanabaena sp. CAN_BIN31]|nr:proline--tRNA ligase [Pseudanabaena sp. CAN_BIN31]
MRLSQMLWVTLREDPAEAELASHKLLLRAGYIRRVGSGLYVYLPLMWRVLQKISAIVREEMNATGAQECLLTQLQPAELWQESGRWDTYTKAEGIMFALTDRANREVGLGPTHEEIITAIARDTIRSYRQLPQHLYQIQTKFRDEIRPRFGLMRGREFIMKDGYSFHTSEESLKETYCEMDRAYRNMFDRCGLKFRAVEADSGAIGGSGSQEFMVLAEAGEDDILFTEDSSYAANVEKAVSLPPDAVISSFVQCKKEHTPKKNTIESLATFLKCHPTEIVKNILYEVIWSPWQGDDSGTNRIIILVSIRGDQEINEVKLQNEILPLLRTMHRNGSLLDEPNSIVSLNLLDETRVDTINSAVRDLVQNRKQSVDPNNLISKLPYGYISPALEFQNYFETANDFSSTDLTRKFELGTGIVEKIKCSSDGTYKILDILKAVKDLSLDQRRNLGKEKTDPIYTLYAESPEFLRLADHTVENLQNFVTGADEIDYHVTGENWSKKCKRPVVVDIRKAKAGDRAVHDPSQILQTARGIEVGHIFQLGTKYSQAMKATFTNEQGEELPLVMGCYGLGVSRLAQAAVEQSYDKDGIIWNKAIAPFHVIVTVPNVGDAKQMEVGEKLYAELNAAKIEVLLDDRDERAGVKFKDADLVGIPYRVVTGKAIADGKVEIVNRATKVATLVAIESVIEYLQNELN